MTNFNRSWKDLKNATPVFMSELEELASRAAQSLEDKRRAAIEYLGATWVFHENYQSGARHSPLSSDRVLVDVQIRAQVAGRI
jgi:hypothetical protein